MSNGLKYKEIGSIESFGKRSIGIKVSVAVGRALTDKEKQVIDAAIETIQHVIEIESELIDPKVQADIAQEKVDLIALFPVVVHAKPIPNEYGERPHYPWFNVTTNRGPIKIGWRRRVISIDWSDSDIKSKAEEIFSKEEVTKGERYIHAWDYEKAKSYIHTLMAVK